MEEETMELEPAGGNVGEGAASTLHIHDLPEPAMLEIFKHFTPVELVRTLQKVCLRWFHLCGDRDLWKGKIIYGDAKVTDAEVLEMFRYQPNIEQLVLHHLCPVTNHGLATAFANASSLRRYTLPCPIIPDRELFSSLVENCPKLEHFTEIQNINLVDFELLQICRLTELREIQFYDLFHLTDDITSLIFEHCTKVQELSICCCYRFGDNGLKAVAECLPHLKSLTLHCVSPLLMDGLVHIGALHELSVLKLHKFDVNLSLDAWNAITTGCTELQELSLRYCKYLPNDCMMKISSKLKLRTLNLSNSVFSLNSLLWFSDDCPTLKSLTLSEKMVRNGDIYGVLGHFGDIRLAMEIPLQEFANEQVTLSWIQKRFHNVEVTVYNVEISQNVVEVLLRLPSSHRDGPYCFVHAI